MTPLAFHAAPRAGEWLNDPNALAAIEGGYRLYAQHRTDAPKYRATNWGAFESTDLLGWRWAGVAVPADDDGWAYSGSALRTPAGLELFHTVNEPDSALQYQRRLTPDGRGWRRASCDPELSRPRTNRRDPFVFAWGDEWRMLLTQSCDWHNWRDDPPSYLVVMASGDRQEWSEVGRIGPWHPAGVLWEVPIIARLDGADVLFVSLVDRRQDGAACSVQGWVGRFDGTGFAVEDGFPQDGQRIDLGPDYYAQISGVAGDWPEATPFIAWAASWATARVPIWPGFMGGPLTLPRRIEVRTVGSDRRLWSTPWPSLARLFRAPSGRPASGCATVRFDGGSPFYLTFSGPEASIQIMGDAATGVLTAQRRAADGFDWSTEAPAAVLPSEERRVTLFIDGPLIELFDEGSGSSLTAALPGGIASAGLSVRGSPVALEWAAYAC